MSEISRPWQSTSPGDAGPYSSQNWNQLYEFVLGWGANRANIGPMLSSGTQPNDGLKVQAKSVPTTSIDVLAGSALVQGIGYISTATVSFVIAANGSGNARIDTVILRADYALQTIRLAVLQGTPAASPVNPTLTQSANVLWEIPLADIAVANGFATITNANITPRHEWANAANGIYIDNVVNNSGSTLNTGDVVIWDSSADRAVTTTTTADNKLLAGVWQGRTINGGYGRVLSDGVGYVNGGAAFTRGQNVINSGVAKQAISQAARPLGARLGIALETTAGAGLALCRVKAEISNSVGMVLLQDQKTSGSGMSTLATGAWRTRDLNTIVSDSNSLATSLAANQLTLVAGTYIAMIALTTFAAGTQETRARLRNITDSATLLQGNNFGALTNLVASGAIMGVFTITGSKVIELQQWPTTTGVGAGVTVSSGDVEVYAEVLLVRIGD